VILFIQQLFASHDVMIMLSEAMGFIPDILQQLVSRQKAG